MCCAKFGWNWPSGSGEEDENVKSFDDNNNYKFWSEKLTWAFGLGELKISTLFDNYCKSWVKETVRHIIKTYLLTE